MHLYTNFCRVYFTSSPCLRIFAIFLCISLTPNKRDFVYIFCALTCENYIALSFVHKWDNRPQCTDAMSYSSSGACRWLVWLDRFYFSYSQLNDRAQHANYRHSHWRSLLHAIRCSWNLALRWHLLVTMPTALEEPFLPRVPPVRLNQDSASTHASCRVG